jgi:hypothetical protein
MKTLIILLTSVLFLNTTSGFCGTNDMAKTKKNVRNQLNYALATSDISDNGTVTIHFYVLNKKVKIQKIEGENADLNQKVKSHLEKVGISQKGLSGYYTITIKLNGSNQQAFTSYDKQEMLELMAISNSTIENIDSIE